MNIIIDRYYSYFANWYAKQRLRQLQFIQNIKRSHMYLYLLIDAHRLDCGLCDLKRLIIDFFDGLGLFVRVVVGRFLRATLLLVRARFPGIFDWKTKILNLVVILERIKRNNTAIQSKMNENGKTVKCYLRLSNLHPCKQRIIYIYKRLRPRKKKSATEKKKEPQEQFF